MQSEFLAIGYSEDAGFTSSLLSVLTDNGTMLKTYESEIMIWFLNSII